MLKKLKNKRCSHFALSHPGLVRKKNEDCFGCDAEIGIWIVADGVGGLDNGEVASHLAVKKTIEAVAAGRTLSQSLLFAHDCIVKESLRQNRHGDMASTAVAVRFEKLHYQICWIGDSRAYLWDGSHLSQLTKDHSLVQSLVDSGALSPRNAFCNPHKHIITQVLGVRNISSDALLIGCIDGTIQAGQAILLCTDGMTNDVDDREIIAIMKHSSCSQEQCRKLIKISLANGGRDNVTVMIIAASIESER